MSELSTLTKVCIRGARCVHPDGPELPATLEYFYRQRSSRDGLQPSCKECIKANTRRNYARNGNKSEKPSNTGEWLVKSHLRSLGIFAEKGAGGHHKYVDLVAWGCVRIEVKTSTLINGRFQFSIGRRANSFHGHDLVILVCKWPDDQATYHVFRPDHPVFYKSRGQLKRGVIYNPTPQHRHNDGLNGMTLSAEIMAEHQDRWDLIEECRLNWRASV